LAVGAAFAKGAGAFALSAGAAAAADDSSAFGFLPLGAFSFWASAGGAGTFAFWLLHSLCFPSHGPHVKIRIRNRVWIF